MNTYQIAPRQSKISMDPELLQNFETLRSALQWRPLTANLESCEEGKHLFFRITLRLTGGGGSTYAGFSSGAPFMLTRDCLEKKKGFFLRHWVRQENDESANLVPYNTPFMHLAVVKDVMIVRVDIDREMTLSDTFKSVPFATWMFQVVQADAFIEDAPGIRFAFAIERTVTPDERTVIMGNVEHTKQQTKLQKAASKISSQRVAPIRMPPSSQAQQGDQTRIANQPVPVKAVAKPTSNGKRALASKQATQNNHVVQPRPLTIGNPSGIIAKTLNPHNAVTMSAVALAPHPRPSGVPLQPVKPRPIARANAPRVQQPTATTHTNAHYPTPPQIQEKRIFHPYLKLWENRKLDDPYEPFFIVDSDEITSKMNKSWRVEGTSNLALQFNYRRLQCLPGADYPSYFSETPDANHGADANQDLLIVHPLKKAKLMDSAFSAVKGDKMDLGDLKASMKHNDNGAEVKNGSKHTNGESGATTPISAVQTSHVSKIDRPNVSSGGPAHSSVSFHPKASIPEMPSEAPGKTTLTEQSEHVANNTATPAAKDVLGSASLSAFNVDSQPTTENQSNSDRMVCSNKNSDDQGKDDAMVTEKYFTSSAKTAQGQETLCEPTAGPRTSSKSSAAAMDTCNIPNQVTNELSESNGIKEDGEESIETDETSTREYITAVKAASEYNSSLAVDRFELQSWLVEDRRFEEEGDASKGDDDASSSSE